MEQKNINNEVFLPNKVYSTTYAWQLLHIVLSIILHKTDYPIVNIFKHIKNLDEQKQKIVLETFCYDIQNSNDPCITFRSELVRLATKTMKCSTEVEFYKFCFEEFAYTEFSDTTVEKAFMIMTDTFAYLIFSITFYALVDINTNQGVLINYLINIKDLTPNEKKAISKYLLKIIFYLKNQASQNNCECFVPDTFIGVANSLHEKYRMNVLPGEPMEEEREH